jgi:hypothetical protein
MSIYGDGQAEGMDSAMTAVRFTRSWISARYVARARRGGVAAA